MMEAMTGEWKDAYAAGIFTEFMEQRAPGHTVAGYKIFQKGMLDIMQDVDQSMAQLDFVNDPQAYDKKEELKAMKIAANALIIFANRHAEKLEGLANSVLKIEGCPKPVLVIFTARSIKLSGFSLLSCTMELGCSSRISSITSNKMYDISLTASVPSGFTLPRLIRQKSV